MLYAADVLSILILTGFEIWCDALAELVVQLRVEDCGVSGVWTQVPQRVLVDPARDPLLNGVGALDAKEETVAGDDGAGSLPDDQCAVVADVGETNISGRVRFWRG